MARARNRRRSTSLLRHHGIALVAIVVTGCSSVGGLTAARVEQADGAWVVTVRSFGVGFRTSASDAGATLGYDRRIYVYRDAPDGHAAEGLHLFFMRLPVEGPVLVHARSIGLEMRASHPDPGVTLGYRDATVLMGVDDPDAYLHLEFAPGRPAATRLIVCNVESPCWSRDIEP